MAFENTYGNIDFQAGNKMQMAQQDQFSRAIGQSIAAYNTAQDRKMQMAQLEAKKQVAQAAAAGDYKQVAMDELNRIAQGGAPTPQGQAAVKVMQQTTRDQTYIDPVTQQMVTNPSPWRDAGATPIIPPVTREQLQQGTPAGSATPFPQPPSPSQSPYADVTQVEPRLSDEGRRRFEVGKEYGARGKVKELDVEADVFKEELRDLRNQKNLQKYNDGQLIAANFANRMRTSTEIMEGLGEDAQKGMTGAAGAAAKLFTALPLGDTGTGMGDAIVKLNASPEQKRYLNAAKNWVTANLRKESGAVIGVEEMANEYAKYFPMPLDTPEVISDKESLREQAQKGMIGQSAGSYQQMFGKKAGSKKSKVKSYKDYF